MKQGFKNKLKYFTPLEYTWLFVMTGISILFSFLYPEEDILWLIIISNIALVSGLLCELLIAKQSKWNFIVSVAFVEITEIAICIYCGYYSSALITLIFWIPIDIISFINWNKHKDKTDDDLTVVRKLNFWQDVLVVVAIAVFGLGVGYLLTLIPGAEETYLDAVCSAVGISNGIFILFRYREQWIAWYIYAILEGTLWILSGQWIMLLLTVGYIINTTYGYIKWTKYIKKNSQKEALPEQEVISNNNLQ